MITINEEEEEEEEQQINKCEEKKKPLGVSSQNRFKSNSSPPSPFPSCLPTYTRERYRKSKHYADHSNFCRHLEFQEEMWNVESREGKKK